MNKRHMAKRKGGKRDKRPKAKAKRRVVAFRINIADDPLYQLDRDFGMTPSPSQLKQEEEQAQVTADAFSSMMNNLPSIKTDKSRRI